MRRTLSLAFAALLASAGLLAAPSPAAASWTGSITILPGGDGTGRITSDDGGIDCSYADSRNSGDCSQSYTFPDFLQSSLVTITYTPAAGSYLCVGSAGGCVTSGAPHSVTMEFRPEYTNHVTLLPTFSLKSYRVQFRTDGPGSIDTGGEPCTPGSNYEVCRLFKHGTQATFTAVPDAGSNFTEWHGSPCDTQQPTCTWTVRSEENVVAVFGKWTLSVAREGSGDACIVAGAPTSCAADLGGSFSVLVPNGTAVALEAQPNAGWRFTSWSGACSGQDESCTITVTSATSVTAKFARVQATATPRPTATPKPAATTTPRPAATASSTQGPLTTPAASPALPGTGPSAVPETTASTGPGAAPADSPDPSGPVSHSPVASALAVPATPAPSEAPIAAGAPATGDPDLLWLLLLATLAGGAVVLIGFVLGRRRREPAPMEAQG